MILFSNKNPVLLLVLMLLQWPVVAQVPESAAPYPQDYFRNPLEIPIFLAGNFGECRPGHFHSGIDIKTLGAENQPVHAAADGYVSRIKMEKGGFGHGLYITHPDGYTTLYAHLNKFSPALQQYLEKEQYEKKHWDVDIQFTPSQYPVKKGDLVAWSGNTGASTAPHLHFEIRNTQTEHPLNPELFGLPIVDKIAPLPAEVAIYNGHIYESEPAVYTLAKQDGIYRPVKAASKTLAVNRDTVQAPQGIVGIGVNVDDYMDGSDNTIAFYTARLLMDDSLQAEVVLDDIGYDETRYINAYADYKTKQLQHKWVQCLFRLPGNRLDHIFRHLNANKGWLDFSDGKVHEVKIILADDRGNTSTIQFYVKPASPPAMQPQGDCTWFYANKANSFTNPGIAFSLDEKQLYDDICFHFSTEAGANIYSDKYQVHYPYVPVHHYFELQINPKPIPFDLRSKVVMMYSDDKSEDGRAAAPADKGWYKAKVRNFGAYWLDIDTIPPVIRPMQKDKSNLAKAKQIAFEVRDAKTSVRSFSGYLDGKWICFEQHGNLFFYNFDAHCGKGKHKLVFRAEDENGNAASTTLNFVR
jgi:hypothetical protein